MHISISVYPHAYYTCTKSLRFSPDIHAACQIPSLHISIWFYLIQAWAFSSRPAPWRGKAPWQRNEGNSRAYVTEPETPKEILDSLPEGYPDTIDDWSKIQKKVWPNAIPVPRGWIRVWSKRRDCEYYLRLEDNFATFEYGEVTWIVPSGVFDLNAHLSLVLCRWSLCFRSLGAKKWAVWQPSWQRYLYYINYIHLFGRKMGGYIDW